MRFMQEAKIVHYLCTSSVDAEEPPFLLNDRAYFEEIKKTGQLPIAVRRLFDHPFEGIASLSYLMSGKDLVLVHDTLYKDLKYCYLNHHRLYKFVTFVVYYIRRPKDIFIDISRSLGILHWCVTLKTIITKR